MVLLPAGAMQREAVGGRPVSHFARKRQAWKSIDVDQGTAHSNDSGLADSLEGKGTLAHQDGSR